MKELGKIRSEVGQALTKGLADSVIAKFVAEDKNLERAITEAVEAWSKLSQEEKAELKKPEGEVICALQAGILNFYAAHGVNPYLPIAAQGPWIVTAYGSVIYEVGGYGMLGWGHNPDFVSSVLSAKQIMANVMTPSLKQRKVVNLLKKQIGFKRGACPFSHFVWMNSGSEAVTVSYRIVDAHSRVMTDPGGKHAGKRIVLAAAKGGFHGRTDSAAQLSDSSMKSYKKLLASFRDRDNLLLFEMNNIDSVKQLFDRAAKENFFIEALYMEPVMGEGNPGEGATPEFYRAVRELTAKSDTLFIVDSIQAGMRAHGCLSIIDYPGFEKLPPPDMEVYSKALNAGQYPLSVLGVTPESAKWYQVGLYGNTMTTNPRGLDVAVAVLSALTPALAANVERRGAEFVQKFKALQSSIPQIITKVQGTGLLFGVELEKNKFPVVGKGGVEEYLRYNGLNVIHGGPNSLRFTPHFMISEKEVDLVVACVKEALDHFAKKQVTCCVAGAVSPSTPIQQ